MEKLQLSEIAAAVGSKTSLEAAVNDICTDTRKLEPGERMQKVRDVIMQAEEKEEEKSSGVEPLMLRGLTERIRQKNL